MDGLPGLENLFLEEFPSSVTARCWVHAMRNALAKTPARLREAFKLLATKIMYASSEADARTAFEDLHCCSPGLCRLYAMDIHLVGNNFSNNGRYLSCHFGVG